MDYFYDKETDTVRRFEGYNPGDRWDKERHEWSSECCPRSACKWDEQVTEKQALVIVERQKGQTS
jgi:hypothetical protein